MEPDLGKWKVRSCSCGNCKYFDTEQIFDNWENLCMNLESRYYKSNMSYDDVCRNWTDRNSRKQRTQKQEGCGKIMPKINIHKAIDNLATEIRNLAKTKQDLQCQIEHIDCMMAVIIQYVSTFSKMDEAAEAMKHWPHYIHSFRGDDEE